MSCSQSDDVPVIFYKINKKYIRRLFYVDPNLRNAFYATRKTQAQKELKSTKAVLS
jgi:hypothetical protein